MGRVVGIDLGTTFSCMAYMEGNTPKVIPNLEGAYTTPSVVSFTSSGEMLIGNLALRQAFTNPEKTIFAVKRLMGKKFKSPEVTGAAQKLSYKLAEGPNGDVMIDLDSRLVSPQEISAMILGYLKKCAESYLREGVTEAVVTVPAHFDDHQRQATKASAEMAGFNVLRVINEPTSASLAFGLNSKKNANVAVFDMGGGTFDITVLEIQDGLFHVLATNGDSYLGGEDFDNRIVDWLIDGFTAEHNLDLYQDKLALQRIKEASERAKRELSFTLETEINLPFIASDKSGSLHIKKTLTRRKLEDLTRDLVTKSVPFIGQALKESRLGRDRIDEFILVGGQTRMPLIRETISDFFRRKPAEHVNPDEIVAMGAAVQGGVLKGKMKEIILLLDVTPLSLGIETENDTFEKIIEKNTTIPTKKTMAFTTVEHNQRRVRIHVLQGESGAASGNRSLAMFDLVGIEPAPAGVPQIDVTFEIDADGLVKVSAKDMVSGREKRIEVRPSLATTAGETLSFTKREHIQDH